MDRSSWMQNLHPSLLGLPLSYFAIPGSHDSFSYSISETGTISPDEKDMPYLSNIPFTEDLAKTIIYNWAVTQRDNCTEQLQAGIRYFEFRLAPNPGSGELRLVQGFYGCTVLEAMDEIVAFLRAHPKEIVILHFHTFYDFSPALHSYLAGQIVELFGTMLCPFNPNLEKLTVATLWNLNQQVFVIYNYPIQNPAVWPGSFIISPWPDTTDADQLVAFLDYNYRHGRPRNKFFVCQGVMIPDNQLVLQRLTSTRESSVVTEAHEAVLEWLRDKRIGPRGINIITIDFISADSGVEVLNKVFALNTVD